jgi:hypothetical protein
MKAGAYFILLLVAVACVGLSVALVVVATRTQRLQIQLQAQQQALSGGILGQQGQEISGSVLQDMAVAAVKNPRLRKLLDQYGYRAPAAASAQGVTNAAGAAAAGPEAL